MLDPTDPTDRPKTTDRPAEVVTVAEAAERLGITTNAIWQRLKRGTLTKAEEPGPDGEALVLLSAAPEPRRGRSNKARKRPTDRPTQSNRPTEPTERSGDVERLIARLEADNAYLRELLDAEIEARRRADHLLAGTLERLAALPATTSEMSVRDAAVDANEAPGRAEMARTAADASASVWTRLRRWLAGR